MKIKILSVGYVFSDLTKISWKPSLNRGNGGKIYTVSVSILNGNSFMTKHFELTSGQPSIRKSLELIPETKEYFQK